MPHITFPSHGNRAARDTYPAGIHVANAEVGRGKSASRIDGDKSTFRNGARIGNGEGTSIDRGVPLVRVTRVDSERATTDFDQPTGTLENIADPNVEGIGINDDTPGGELNITRLKAKDKISVSSGSAERATVEYNVATTRARVFNQRARHDDAAIEIQITTGREVVRQTYNRGRDSAARNRERARVPSDTSCIHSQPKLSRCAQGSAGNR